MAKKSDKNHKKPKAKRAYMTKRFVLRATRPAIRKAAKRTLEVMGYTVVYKDGWLVRINKDGTEDKIKQIKRIKRTSKIALD